MGWKHRLIDVNAEVRTATCAACGPNSRIRPNRSGWRCGYRRPGEGAESKRLNRLKVRFGITATDYDRIWDEQGRGCAICGTVEPIAGRTYHPVDHDHATGIVRGILCQPCNIGLGSFRDNPVLMQRAIGYLERARKKAPPRLP